MQIRSKQLSKCSFGRSARKEDLNTRANERISYVLRVMKKEIRLRESTRWLTRQYLILLDEIMKAIYPMKSKKMTRWQEYGFYGFMVGWAENAARYVKGKPEKQSYY